MSSQTWAGTFVLAALSLVFPKLHLVLLDSDCVPVTLFEVADLWKEAQLVRNQGLPSQPASSDRAGGTRPGENLVTLDTIPEVGQGVLLVTEHSLLILPGNGMYQAQRIVEGKCRPVVLHG